MGIRRAAAEPRTDAWGTPGPTSPRRRDATAGAWGLGFLAGALAALALATGCSPDLPPWTAPEDTAAADTAADTATDTGADTGADTATDTATDTAADAVADTGSDTANDTATDAVADTASDTGTDTGTDAAADAAADTAAGTAADAVTDTGSDTATDAVTDTAADAGADTAADAVADTGADTATDAVADTGADTATDAVTDIEADTGADTAADAVTDTGSDTAADTATDTGADTAADTGADTAADTGPTGCTSDEECTDATWGTGTCLDGTCLSAGFVAIPAGSFLMGSPSGEVGHMDNEIQHSVTLTHPFELQQMELTRGQWRAVMGPDHTPATQDCADDACPIASVNWWEAATFANELSSARGLPPCYDLSECQGTIGDINNNYTCQGVPFIPGSFYECQGYRLPSEAEWEYAYRAGTTTPLYNGGSLTDAGANSGQTDLDPIAWYGETANAPQHGGLKEANLWGLYDMAGNVWEFTSDGWVDFQTGDAPVDPAWVGGDTGRVSRGGAVGGQAQYCRAAQRGWIEAGTREPITGLRLARTLPNTLVPCVAQTAACDGVDDNCDGLTDNAAALDPPPTPLQAGVCQGATQTCAAADGGGASWIYDYTTIPGYEATETTAGDGLDNDCDGLVLVAAGQFEMGCFPHAPQLPGCSAAMHKHWVTLTHAFSIMPLEVSREDWIATMGTTPSSLNPPCPTCPMGGLSWYDGLAYANTLSDAAGLTPCYDLTGCSGTPGGGSTNAFTCTSVSIADGTSPYDCTGYRLPTEAEWEYAYRAGTDTPFFLAGATNFSGCDPADAVLLSGAYYQCNAVSPYLAPGGSFQPNAWGLYDMAGNVQEPTWDYWSSITTSDAATDPLGGVTSAQGRVFRGGSSDPVNGSIGYLLAGVRQHADPGFHNWTMGLRLVRTAP